MEFKYIADGIDAMVIDNFYTEDQLKEIELELSFLTRKAIMLDEKHLASGTDNSGNIMTSKNGVFLESVYKNHKHSPLITSTFKQMDTESFNKEMLGANTLFKSLFYCNTRSHLLSYYENSDYYKPHVDSFFFTLLSYFYKEPKQFTGGNLVLKSCNSDKEAVIEVKHNRTVVIASSTLHEALPIKSEMTNTLSGNGRYCNAAFLSVRDSREIKNDSN
jgi:hypothetical protein